jgi:hypothetical protein
VPRRNLKLNLKLKLKLNLNQNLQRNRHLNRHQQALTSPLQALTRTLKPQHRNVSPLLKRPRVSLKKTTHRPLAPNRQDLNRQDLSRQDLKRQDWTCPNLTGQNLNGLLHQTKTQGPLIVTPMHVTRRPRTPYRNPTTVRRTRTRRKAQRLQVNPPTPTQTPV